ncbi:hypothetical protein K438DRAFT_1944149 [Mycena galopus ATCC 62051]|nr:hypothetical protein K438DRAFT_1944149 [Mycena galopus ATCC 62051]
MSLAPAGVLRVSVLRQAMTDGHKSSSSLTLKPVYSVNATQTALIMRSWDPVSIYKDWFTCLNPPLPWSTDWDDWDGQDICIPDARGERKIDHTFKKMYGVSDPIEPIAYIPGGGTEWIVFAAGGRYYHYDDGTLRDYGREFSSKEDFLRTFMDIDLGTEVGELPEYIYDFRDWDSDFIEQFPAFDE